MSTRQSFLDAADKIVKTEEIFMSRIDSSKMRFDET